ncbi:MAG: hypothetical protein D6834_03595 [Aquificota bacterium]|nr:MAG: hypothetical protein D6834_03595 [Aquificota bacterium]
MKKKRFTLIEILMCIILLSLLFSILLPSLREARRKAKFTRWQMCIRNWANDPDCVLNYNFQDGPGSDILRNGADGCDSERYQPKFYNGYLMNDQGVDVPHNFEWVPSGGRWGKYKKALQFNGSDTYILVPTVPAVDFTPNNGFTIITWLKFDKIDLGDCPFAKSLWGTARDASAQYDLYSNTYAGKYGQGSFDVDAFTICATWSNTEVDFDKAGWVQLVLRYKPLVKDDPLHTPNGFQLMCFVNGEPLSGWQDTTDDNPYTASATDWESTQQHQVPLFIGCAGGYRKYWARASWDPNDDSLDNLIKRIFFVQGIMDEFLVFKRALSDGEIVADYEMGKDL